MSNAQALERTEKPAVTNINPTVASHPSGFSNRALLQAGGSFAGAGFLAGAYFGLTGAIMASVLAFVVTLFLYRRSSEA